MIRNRSNPLFWMPIIFLIKFIDEIYEKNNSPIWQRDYNIVDKSIILKIGKSIFKNSEIIFKVAEEGLEPPTRGL